MMTTIAKVSKAIAGAAAAFSAGYASALNGGVSPDEWAVIAGATAAAFLVVWLAPKNTTTEESR